MRQTSRKLAVTLSIAAGFLLAALPVAAQGLQMIPTSCIDQGGNSPAPSLDCILNTGIAIGRVFFGLAGSFALLMFVIGGFYYVTSAGRDDMVKKGKEYIKNAVIGLVIILTAAYFVEYGVGALKPKCVGRVYSDTHGVAACCPADNVVVTKTDASGALTQQCVSGDQACVATHADWTCEDVTQRTDKGAGCEHNLCLGANKSKPNTLCCPAETPAAAGQ